MGEVYRGDQKCSCSNLSMDERCLPWKFAFSHLGLQDSVWFMLHLIETLNSLCDIQSLLSGNLLKGRQYRWQEGGNKSRIHLAQIVSA